MGSSRGRMRWLYRLLRPELVAGHGCPLSSDACSPFGRGGAGRDGDDAEVLDATRRLHEEVLPELARRWAVGGGDAPRSAGPGVAAALHAAGVNLRWAGRLLLMVLR
eukprot:gene23420-5120_t